MVNGEGAPDYIEPVVGWRAWYAIEEHGSAHLASVVHHTLWPYRVPLTAVCHAGPFRFWPFKRERHDAPSDGCRCGIYAGTIDVARDYVPEFFAFSRAIPVVGQVRLWGSVHECEHGWRASHAYPARLFVPGREVRGKRPAALVDDLWRYGVPVHIVDDTTSETVLSFVSSRAAA